MTNWALLLLSCAPDPARLEPTAMPEPLLEPEPAVCVAPDGMRCLEDGTWAELEPVSAERLAACQRACACAPDADFAAVCRAAGRATLDQDGKTYCVSTQPQRPVRFTTPDPSTFEPGKASWFAKDPRFRTGDSAYLEVIPSRIEATLHRIAASSDQAEVVTLGHSHIGQPILALRYKNPDAPAVLITGATHGDELLSARYALDVLHTLEDPASTWADDLDLWVVPAVNPDGLWAALYVDASLANDRNGRKNGRDFVPPCGASPGTRGGVDLNRNFPTGWGRRGSSSGKKAGTYRGVTAGSEPETQALMRLADQQHFVAAAILHTNARAVLVPYTVTGMRSPEPPIQWAVARTMAAASPQRFHVQSELYPVAGTDQDWLFFAHGTLAYIVEGSHHNPVSEDLAATSIAGVRPVWQALLTRVSQGPRVSGHVVGPDGEPVAGAIVTLDGEVFHEGEQWTTRDDGRFDRLVAKPGEVGLTVTLRDRHITATVDATPVGTVKITLP